MVAVMKFSMLSDAVPPLMLIVTVTVSVYNHYIEILIYCQILLTPGDVTQLVVELSRSIFWCGGKRRVKIPTHETSLLHTRNNPTESGGDVTAPGR